MLYAFLFIAVAATWCVFGERGRDSLILTQTGVVLWVLYGILMTANAIL